MAKEIDMLNLAINFMDLEFLILLEAQDRLVKQAAGLATISGSIIYILIDSLCMYKLAGGLELYQLSGNIFS